MKFDPRGLLVPLVAVLVLALAFEQTMGALKASGAWQRPARRARIVTEDPYTRLDHLLAAHPEDLTPEHLHNPFVLGPVRSGVPANPGPRPPVHRTPVVVAPPRPTLTSIIWDADPRATVRYDGRDYSVRENSLFEDFRVKSITANQIVLDRNGETIVLALRPKGD